MATKSEKEAAKPSWEKEITVDAEPNTVPEQTRTDEPEQKKTSTPGKPLPEQRVSKADWEANKLENNVTAAGEDNGQNYEAESEDVGGRSDVQKTAEGNSSREVRSVSDALVAMNEMVQQNSTYSDQALRVGGKDVTAVTNGPGGISFETKKSK